MPNITLLPLEKADAHYIKVELIKAPAPMPFAPDQALIPAAALSFKACVKPDEHNYWQKLGRTLAAFGLRQVQISSQDPDLQPDLNAAQLLLIGMDDGRHDLKVALNLDTADCDKAQILAQTLADFRTLANLDSKHCLPLVLIDEVFAKLQQIAKRQGGFTLSLKVKDASDPQCVGIRAVSGGSANAGALGIIDIKPEGAGEAVQVALVGKGITFDSGGYDLKPPSFMALMRTDKCGAVYLGAACALAMLQGLKAHVRLYLCAAENLTGTGAMLPGDIIQYPNGLRVEIDNTDAEGRLVLADGLLAAAADQAQLIVDAATLTGAAKHALGRDFAAVFTRQQQIPQALMQAFTKTGERGWPLPLLPEYARFMRSDRADLLNTGHGDGAPGAGTAAYFLSRFVPDKTEWIHLDLACAVQAAPSPWYAPGPTGMPARSLALYIAGLPER